MRDTEKMTARAGVCCLVACLLVHAADQVTDTITALIYFAQVCITVANKLS